MESKGVEKYLDLLMVVDSTSKVIRFELRGLDCAEGRIPNSFTPGLNTEMVIFLSE